MRNRTGHQIRETGNQSSALPGEREIGRSSSGVRGAWNVTRGGRVCGPVRRKRSGDQCQMPSSGRGRRVTAFYVASCGLENAGDASRVTVRITRAQRPFNRRRAAKQHGPLHCEISSEPFTRDASCDLRRNMIGQQYSRFSTQWAGPQGPTHILQVQSLTNAGAKCVTVPLV